MRAFGKVVLTGVLVFGLCQVATATTVEFSFEAVNQAVLSPISSYMTNLYGSQVRVYDAYLGDTGWSGQSDTYLSTSLLAGGDFEVHFAQNPITKLYGTTDAYVFDATIGADFTVKAYDSTFGLIGFPDSSALVFSQSWNTGTGYVNFSDVIFSRPVSLLVFSNAGVHDVGIDNLKVESARVAVPEPVTLLVVGTGIVGLAVTRRFMR